MNRLIEKIFLSLILFLSLSNFSYSADGSALIIIDMQLPFVTRGGNDKIPENVTKVHEIINTQLEAIKMAKLAKIPIVFIEYEDNGETNPELKKAAEGYGDVKYFVKNSDGMFEYYNSSKEEIKKYLDSKQVKTLIITGANGGACVFESIRGSLDDNYNVLAVSKAIADFNYKEFIYPYEKIYSFKPTCKDCTFREVDNVETVALELAAKQMNNKKEVGQGLDEGKREPKMIVPGTSKESGLQNSSNSTSK